MIGERAAQGGRPYGMSRRQTVRTGRRPRRPAGSNDEGRYVLRKPLRVPASGDFYLLSGFTGPALQIGPAFAAGKS